MVPKQLPRVLIAIILALLPALAVAQRQNDIWYFGGGLGLDFRTSPPSRLDSGGLFTDEGCASIADHVTGAMLFYTDGRLVFNRERTAIFSPPMRAPRATPPATGSPTRSWTCRSTAAVAPSPRAPSSSRWRPPSDLAPL